MTKCLLPFRAFHQLGWPRQRDAGNIQTCVNCGQQFPTLVTFEINPQISQGETPPCKKNFTAAA